MNHLEFALGEYGEKEIVGAGTSKRVLEYFSKSGNSWVKDDETAWCSAFVGYVLESCGIKSTKKLNARSYLKWGKPTTTPKMGDIVVLWRQSKTSAFGHVGFFIRKKDGLVYMLAGNQNNQVDITGFPESRVLEYRTW